MTKAQQEARAAIELANQGFEVYLPVLSHKPMFPRYIFSYFDRDTDPWGKVKSTRGCIDILKNGFTPVIVPTAAIEAIMAYTPAEEPADGPIEFTAGQPVKIVDGVLSGLEGLFVADKKARVSCLLEILGRKVEVPRESIRAA